MTPVEKTRSDLLSEVLTHAFDELLDISEAPNRNEHLSHDALELAIQARRACAYIEANDPDRGGQR